MIKEEWRLHKSLTGGFGSALFPVMIFMFTAIAAYITPYIMGNIQLTTILLMLHVSSLIYGIFVGGFGAIGEHVMTRRLGQVNMLLQLPLLLPISFKRVMGIFYIKDSLYYVVYTFIPLVLGIGLVAPHAGVTYAGVLRLGGTMFLTFMMGMGVSFALSALSIRSKKRSLALTLGILGLVAMVYPLDLIPASYLLPPLGYWETGSVASLAISAVESTVLALIGVFFMKEQFEIRQKTYDESFLAIEDQLSGFGSLRTLVAKEWLELRRSGSLMPAVMGFSGHLLAIYFVSWLFQTGFGIPISFNVVFFSGFVGFMGVMTYSFLTNLEHNEYLNVMPVSVDSVVKAKLSIYFVLTSGITVLYVVMIGLLKNQMHLVPMGLFVAASTSLFVVAVTAYLTGLWTNTMFFSAKTILKFTAIVVPPLTTIEIGTMLMQFLPDFGVKLIYGTSILLFFVSAIVFRSLGNKWKGVTFSYVSTGV
jgi:uncharacterized membrane protein YkvA (DUF1232 family)